MPSTKPKKKVATPKRHNKRATELDSFHRNKTNKHKDDIDKEISNRQRIPGVVQLTKSSYRNLAFNPKQFTIVSAIYLFLTLLLVRGFSATVNIIDLKNKYLSGKGSAIGSDFSAFGSLLGTSVTSPTASNNLYQTFLFIIFSLVFIWMLRGVFKDRNLGTREVFYKSQGPLVPFIIVIFFLILELLPATIGLFLYATVFSNGIAVHVLDKVLLGGLSFIFIAASIYLLVSSLFAMYIVTLPDVLPIQALKSSWRLTKKRKLVVLRKIVFMVIALAILVALVSIIFIAIIPPAAPYIFFTFSIVAILLAHTYIYNLYRSML